MTRAFDISPVETQQEPGLANAEAWAALSHASSSQDYLDAWVNLQCAIVTSCVQASVVLDADDGNEVWAHWPQGSHTGELPGIIATARSRARGVIEDHPESGDGLVLAYPILVNGVAHGGAAIRVPAEGRSALLEAMRQLQWGMAWLRERVGAELEGEALLGSEVGRTVLDALAAALDHADLVSSTRAVATFLAERFACDRVSIGMVRKGESRVLSVSHSANFGKEMNLIRQLGLAMDEAIDQGRLTMFPPPPDTLILTDAHEALARDHGAGVILTLPMSLDEKRSGAICLERPKGQPFSTEDAAILDTLASALAPIFEDKRLNDRNIAVKVFDSIAEQWRRLVGRDHAAYKAVVGALVLLTALFSFWHDTYRVTGNAIVEGREQRAISVSYNGFLREAPVRAGDLVEEGDVLAVLDDRDLVLERLKWTTEHQRHSIAYEKALSDGNRTELRVAESLMGQADAQIKLIDEQLARSKLVAPFDGLIVSGDLSQQIGAAVQRGQILYEIAPVAEHRVMLSIEENAIADLEVGQTGQLVVAALPDHSFPVKIERMTPVAEVVEGSNVFIVEAWPAGETSQLRPGMRGAAKIEIGPRRVIWIWTHAFFDWLSLAKWRWL